MEHDALDFTRYTVSDYKPELSAILTAIRDNDGVLALTTTDTDILHKYIVHLEETTKSLCNVLASELHDKE